MCIFKKLLQTTKLNRECKMQHYLWPYIIRILFSAAWSVWSWFFTHSCVHTTGFLGFSFDLFLQTHTDRPIYFFHLYSTISSAGVKGCKESVKRKESVGVIHADHPTPLQHTLAMHLLYVCFGGFFVVFFFHLSHVPSILFAAAGQQLAQCRTDIEPSVVLLYNRTS